MEQHSTPIPLLLRLRLTRSCFCLLVFLSSFLPASLPLSPPLSFPSFLSHLKSIKNRATFFFFNDISGTSLVVQRLKLRAPNAGDPGFGLWSGN